MGQRAHMHIILLFCAWSPGILAAGAEQADQRGDDAALPVVAPPGPIMITPQSPSSDVRDMTISSQAMATIVPPEMASSRTQATVLIP